LARGGREKKNKKRDFREGKLMKSREEEE